MQDGCHGVFPSVSPRSAASRMDPALVAPWEVPAASARAPAAAEIPTGSQGPAPPSHPVQGEALAGPADIPALPACRAGRSCEATPGSSLSAPQPFAPSTAGLPNPALPSGGGSGAKPRVSPQPEAGVTTPHSPISRWHHQPQAPQKGPRGFGAGRASPSPPLSLAGAGYLHSLCKRDFIIAFSQPISILVIGVVLISVWLGVDGGPAMLQR